MTKVVRPTTGPDVHKCYDCTFAPFRCDGCGHRCCGHALVVVQAKPRIRHCTCCLTKR